MLVQASPSYIPDHSLDSYLGSGEEGVACDSLDAIPVNEHRECNLDPTLLEWLAYDSVPGLVIGKQRKGAVNLDWLERNRDILQLIQASESTSFDAPWIDFEEFSMDDACTQATETPISDDGAEGEVNPDWMEQNEGILQLIQASECTPLAATWMDLEESASHLGAGDSPFVLGDGSFSERWPSTVSTFQGVHELDSSQLPPSCDDQFLAFANSSEGLEYLSFPWEARPSEQLTGSSPCQPTMSLTPSRNLMILAPPVVSNPSSSRDPLASHVRASDPKKPEPPNVLDSCQPPPDLDINVALATLPPLRRRGVCEWDDCGMPIPLDPDDVFNHMWAIHGIPCHKRKAVACRWTRCPDAKNRAAR
ncbi:hypothetical protein DFH09DRAFT_1325334 [Mycena vulgaris]|nr:hypothetical protein DFH09DRAFT_1325334 [Mycena vulgaris]